MQNKIIAIEATANISGGRAYIEELLPLLLKRMPRHDFVIFGPKLECFAALSASGRISTVEPRLPRFSGDLKWPGIAKLFWRLFVFPLAIRRLRPACLFVTANFYSRLIDLLRVPVVVGIHNLVPFHEPHWYTESIWTHRLRVRILRYLTNGSIRRAAGLIAFSGYARELLNNAGADPNRISVIHHGRPSGPLPRWSGADSNTFLCVANYLPYKRMELAIRALGILRERNSIDFRLVIQGFVYDHPYLVELKRLVGSLGLTGYVRLETGVPRDELYAMYQSARALVFPAIGENCPITLLEAMKIGIPIIASDAKPMKELCGDAALYFAVDRPEECAQRMMELTVYPDRGRGLSAAAEQRSELFNWESVAARTAEMLGRSER
jgi:glycosyltransferase involved in cell wall biosynthesis